MEKKCKQCGATINPKTDDTLCGYDRCVKCCGVTCGHSIHYNPNIWERGENGFLVRKSDKNKCNCPEGYHKMFTECRGY